MQPYLLLFLNLTLIYCSAQNPNKDYSDTNPTVNGNNIFRSTENLYRIKIPKKWSINKGNSLGVEFNAKSPLEDASLSIIVANLKTPPKFTAHDVPAETIIESLKKNIPSTTLIESEKQFLSNEKAMYIKYKFNYKTLDIDTDIICIQYSVIKKTRMFTITLQAQELTYPIYSDVFKETLESFVFEDWESMGINIQGQAIETTKPEWPSKLTSYYLTMSKRLKSDYNEVANDCFNIVFDKEFAAMISDWENRNLTTAEIFSDNQLVKQRIEMCSCYANGETVLITLGPSEINKSKAWTASIVTINEDLSDYDKFPDIQGLKKLGTSTNTNSFVINGKLVFIQSITMRYLPQVVGTITIPSFKMKINNRSIKSMGASLKVTAD